MYKCEEAREPSIMVLMLSVKALTEEIPNSQDTRVDLLQETAKHLVDTTLC